MARVSFEDVKRVAIALGWVLLFALVGIVVTLILSRWAPAWGGQGWQFLRDVVYGLIGFAVATIFVGKVLAKESWDRLGWHRPVGSRLVNGMALGLLMAAIAVGLAFVVDRTTVSLTYDWSSWPRVAVWLGVMFLCAALAEELMFRGFPLPKDRRLEFRIEAYNVFNWVNYAIPSGRSVATPATFGRITGSLGDPRQMQFAIKFYY